MPPTRTGTRSTSEREAQTTTIPEANELNSLLMNDLRALCQQHGLRTDGRKESLKRRLSGARESRTVRKKPRNKTRQETQDGGDDLEVTQEITNTIGSNDNESLTFNAEQLAQIRSLVTESIDGAIQKAAQTAAQAAVNAFTADTSTLGTSRSTTTTTTTGTQDPPAPNDNITSLQQLQDLLNKDSTTTSMENSIHELPAKLVKEALTGEFMELSRFLPKNIDLLNTGDEPLTLTVENSVIKLSHAKKTTSITNIEEWTSAFSAYMSVIISKSPDRASELLEYMSLIRYAAKYHMGLGWCVYDIKCRQKAANNKALKWSVIDSQLWLKTFTVSPSRMKEELSFFHNGPYSSGTRGNDIRTCHNYNKGSACARVPCMFAHKCNRPGCGKDHPGYKCNSQVRDSERSEFNTDTPHRSEKPTSKHQSRRDR